MYDAAENKKRKGNKKKNPKSLERFKWLQLYHFKDILILGVFFYCLHDNLI